MSKIGFNGKTKTKGKTMKTPKKEIESMKETTSLMLLFNIELRLKEQIYVCKATYT